MEPVNINVCVNCVRPGLEVSAKLLLISLLVYVNEDVARKIRSA